MTQTQERTGLVPNNSRLKQTQGNKNTSLLQCAGGGCRVGVARLRARTCVNFVRSSHTNRTGATCWASSHSKTKSSTVFNARSDRPCLHRRLSQQCVRVNSVCMCVWQPLAPRRSAAPHRPALPVYIRHVSAAVFSASLAGRWLVGPLDQWERAPGRGWSACQTLVWAPPTVSSAWTLRAASRFTTSDCDRPGAVHYVRLRDKDTCALNQSGGGEKKKRKKDGPIFSHHIQKKKW